MPPILFFRIGEVARLGDHDDDTAVQHFQQALRHDPGHVEAIAALEKLARERRDDALLADMLARRVEAVATAAERVDLLVEVAELERRAGRTDAALAALGRASQEAPTDVRVLGPLADLYFAAGRLDEAAPIYDRLAEEAKAARRMKDVARFRQRQGGIFEARGDRPRALTAYEEALRVNPTDVVTMTGLGRLYFSAGDWEKAREDLPVARAAEYRARRSVSPRAKSTGRSARSTSSSANRRRPSRCSSAASRSSRRTRSCAKRCRRCSRLPAAGRGGALRGGEICGSSLRARSANFVFAAAGQAVPMWPSAFAAADTISGKRNLVERGRERRSGAIGAELADRVRCTLGERERSTL